MGAHRFTLGRFAWFSAAMLCLCGALPAIAAEAVLVGGTGSGSRLLQALADEYHKSAPTAQVIVVDPPLGSGAAIKGLKTGKLQVAVSARRLEGEEKQWDLVEIEFARTPFVFASRDGERSGGFSLVQLADVYAGRWGAWDNGAPIRLILRPDFDADTIAIRAMSPRLGQAVTQALARQGMVTASSDMEALKMIEEIPGSLGPTTLGLVRLLNSGVHVFPIDGRTPSAKALAERSYPWFKTLYLVIRKQPGADVQAFVDFLRSRQAGDFLARSEHLPVSHAK